MGFKHPVFHRAQDGDYRPDALQQNHGIISGAGPPLPGRPRLPAALAAAPSPTTEPQLKTVLS